MSKIGIWKRGVSLFLALLMSMTALTVRAGADLTVIPVPDPEEMEAYQREIEAAHADAQAQIDAAQAEADAAREEMENYLTEQGFIELPPYEDPEPIDYEDTLIKDFGLDEDWKVGNGAKFPSHVGLPTAADARLEVEYAKLSTEAKAAFTKEMDQLQKEYVAAQEELSKSESAYENFMKEFDKKMRQIKNKYCGKKQKGSYRAKTDALKGEKGAFSKTVTESKAKVTKAESKITDLEKSAKTNAPRNGRGYKIKKGALIAINIVVALIGFYDLCENPTVGYKSAYLEDLATFCRSGSIVFGLLSAYPPFAGMALGFAIADTIMTSETMKALLNKYLPDLGWLDENTEYRNREQQKLFLKILNWYYRDYTNREQETDMRKNAHLANKLSPATTGGMLPPGIYEIVRGATACANNVSCYKPNIYLYPESPTEMSLRFGHPTALSVTDPLYPREGWTVTACPDGTLYEDGAEYGFLFYEAVTSDRYYQTREGYLIPAEDRAGTFASILEGYGLNEKEISDFNDYWCERLEPGWDYAMYPQLTETVDEAMPLSVSPAPDTILRIWFAFVRNETPAVQAESQALVRTGVTLVEWGGLFLGE